MGHHEAFPKDSADSKEKEPSWLRGSKKNLLDKVELEPQKPEQIKGNMFQKT